MENLVYKPNYISKYNIYDILYNPNGYVVIITPYVLNNPIIKLIHENNVVTFSSEICPHKHTVIYFYKVGIYSEEIKIIINDNILLAKCNKYPDFKDEIIMSTIVKNEDKYMKQWINYHRILGVTRFIIYDNSNSNTLSELLKKEIEKNVVVLIHWNYPYILPVSGISGQTTQQNHSIYAFQNSKYIGLLDVDEYVNTQKTLLIDDCFNDIITKQQLNVMTSNSGFKLENRFFYNPNRKPTENYDFLSITNCGPVTNSTTSYRTKVFVIPQNVKTFSVHEVTRGLPVIHVNINNTYFNHYSFLNKTHRGFDKTDTTDDTIVSKICLLDTNDI